MKNLEYLKAWIEGKPVQMLINSERWVDLESPNTRDEGYPFFDGSTFRIKPEPKKMKVAIARIMRFGDAGECFPVFPEHTKDVEHYANIVSDWVEIELKE